MAFRRWGGAVLKALSPLVFSEVLNRSRQCNWPVHVLTKVFKCFEDSSELRERHSVQTVMGAKKDFEINSNVDREQVQVVKNVFIFTQPFTYPIFAVLFWTYLSF